MGESFGRCAALALMLLLVSGVAAAQVSDDARATAQALFDEARRLMAQGKHDAACPKLEESQRLDPGVGTEFNLAVCYEAIGRKASAWSLYLEVAAAAHNAAERAREQAARTRAAALEPKLPRLQILVPDQARVTGLRIDRGTVAVGPGQWGVALPTDPGQYTVTASAPGKQTLQVRVTVPDNAETYTLTLSPLVDAPTPPPDSAQAKDKSFFESLGTQRTIALGVGAGAVVALGVGGVFGLVAIHDNSASKSNCAGNACNAEGLKRRNDALANGNRATVAFVAGGVLAVAGAALYLTGSPEERARPLALQLLPAIAPDQAGVLAQGRF